MRLKSKLLLLSALSLCSCASELEAEVANKYWRRAIEMEKYQLIKETNDHLPANHVQLLDTKEECDTEINMDGTFEVDCWNEYTYTIWSWEHFKTLRTSGVFPKKPKWAEFQIPDPNIFRAAHYDESLFLSFNSEKGRFEYDADKQTYDATKRGDSCFIKIRFNKVIDADCMS